MPDDLNERKNQLESPPAGVGRDPAAPPSGQERDPAMESLASALRTTFFLLKLAMALAVVVFLLRGFFIVDAGSVALKRRFGRYVRDTRGVQLFEERKLHYAIPLIEEVDLVDLKLQTINFEEVFIPQRSATERARGAGYASGALTPAVDGYAITGDTNILHMQWQVEYRVRDPYRFLISFSPERTEEINLQTGKAIYRSGPEAALRAVFRNAVVQVTAGTPIDDALKKSEVYESRVQDTAAALLREIGCGLALSNVSIKAPAPPTSTLGAFHEVTEAQQQANQRIDQAMARAREVINDAAGQRAEILSEASVYRSDLLAAARADAERMGELLERFEGDPAGLQVYLEQNHYEFLSELLPEVRLRLMRPGQTWYVTAPPVGEAFEDEGE
jgi:membrane protease subunit HflK